MRGRYKKLFVFMMLVTILCGFFMAHTAQTSAAINPQINFQGKLTNPDGTNVTDGTYSIVFSIYSVSSGGSAVWTETQSTVGVSSGIFQVALGSVTTLPGSVDFNSNSLYLGVKVGADAEMTPRVRLTAVPYAFNADSLGGILASGYGTLAGVQTWASANTFTGLVTANGGASITGGINNNTGDITNVGNLKGVTTLSIGTTSTASYAIDIRNSSSSALHFSPNGTDTGAYLTPFLDNGFFLSGGAAFNGTAWVAKATTASIMDTVNGQYLFFSNSGLTAGSTYTPTQRFAIDGSGNIAATGTLTGLTGLTVASGGSSITGTTNLSGGNLTVQQTGTGAAAIINRTDGVISSLKSGLTKSTFVFDNTGTFGIAFDTRTNIASGTGAGTDAITILGSGNVGVGNTTPGATFSVGTGDLFQVAGASGNFQSSGTGLIKTTNANAFRIQDSTATNTLLAADTSALKVTITGAAQVTGNIQVGSLRIGSSATAGDILVTDASGNLSFSHPDFGPIYHGTTVTTGNNVLWTGTATTVASATGATVCLTTNGVCTGTAVFPTAIFSIQVSPLGGTNAGNTPHATVASISADRRTLVVVTTNNSGGLGAAAYVAATVYVTVLGN